jgi:hypothetical protein
MRVGKSAAQVAHRRGDRTSDPDVRLGHDRAALDTIVGDQRAPRKNRK